jgi:hypothetical protein
MLRLALKAGLILFSGDDFKAAGPASEEIKG